MQVMTIALPAADSRIMEAADPNFEDLNPRFDQASAV